jgi:hypothetical protein
VPLRERPGGFRVLSGDAGDVGCAWTADVLWRSDLRDPGFSDGAGAFLFDAGAGLLFAGGAGPEAVRVPFRALLLGVLLGVPFVCAAGRALRFTGSGVGGAASLFTRDDLRTPFSKTVVGPSTAKGLQGGDTAREAGRVGVLSSSLRRLAGRCMTPPSP